MRAIVRRTTEISVPSPHNWRTTDQDETNRRRLRAQTELFRITNQDGRHPIYSNFQVVSPSRMNYSVEIRSVRDRQYACDCVDFRINGLGTCKHVEAVLLHLGARHKRLFASSASTPTTRLDLVVDRDSGTLRVIGERNLLPASARREFDDNGCLRGASPEEIVATFKRLQEGGHPETRVSQEVGPWLETRRRLEERRWLRREYERRVHGGEWPMHETKVPLYPYQREGMLHLAFTERALLADEMGLGKTIQAIAACALLLRLGKAHRVAVVAPASLKTEWEEQIQRFTDLPFRLVYGQRHLRLRMYDQAPFFTVLNYEQVLSDGLEINARLRPDVVVLDEAQRIKNWSTKTAQAVKRLKSRYAFVLTGTPIENRIDELHSLMDFLEPSLLGPHFRFNREYYELDERGRPKGYRNLGQLHERIRPYMLRRRKSDVETELPDRSDRQLFVPLSDTQRGAYGDHEAVVARLASAAKRRPLTQQEQEKLMRHLAMMRMVCDTCYILDPEDRACPKLGELEKLLDTCVENAAKVIVFSEWERMLELVRELCERAGLGYAWHTGSVPQRRRRAEINAFKTDPACRVFLSTESGSAGLNLQVASVVINCDLPWNPARLEQRIARAWRKHQTRAVTVINLVSENTIEHRMLETLSNKQALADGVLDLKGDLQAIKLRTGQQAFLARLEQILVPRSTTMVPAIETQRRALPADRALGFAQQAAQRINGSLISCEERFPKEGAHSVLYVVVDRDAAAHQNQLAALHEEYFGRDQSDPLAPVKLEIVDRATHEALERLAASGLITLTARGSRPLLPAPGHAEPELSEEERRRAKECVEKADRLLRMARVLAPGGFETEARGQLLEATIQVGRALAVRHRMPEPGTLEDALLPRFTHLWPGTLPTIRQFVRDASAPWAPVADALTDAAKSAA